MNWLGKKQTQILNLLKEGPKTLTELEEITSFDKRTIRNTLMEIYGVGVVKEIKGFYTYIEPKTPIVYDTEEVTVHESQLKNLSRVI